MLIREYRPEDCRMLAELFYRTVHQVNARDYTQRSWRRGRREMLIWRDGTDPSWIITVWLLWRRG